MPDAALLAIVVALTFAIAGCTPPREPARATAPGPADTPSPPLAPGPPPLASSGPAAAAPPTGVPPIVVPVDALYVCVSENGGVQQQVTIELAPGVAALCRKHPEMGPCQYERNACRRGGGRVYAADGREITVQTETEYDTRVTRIRLRSN